MIMVYYNLYDISSMNEDEIRELPEDILLTLDNARDIRMIPDIVWTYFTEEQLAWMSVLRLAMLSDCALEMLSEKYKGSSHSYIIEKRIKDKSIPVIAEPIGIRLNKAIKKKKERKDRLDIVRLSREKLLRFNSERENSYIPLDWIAASYMMDIHNIEEAFHMYVCHREVADIKEYENQEIIDDIERNQNYVYFITKHDFIICLEKSCSRDIHLERIPDLRKKDEILIEYDMEYYKRPISRAYSKGIIDIYRIANHTLCEYDDLIRFISYIGTQKGHK